MTNEKLPAGRTAIYGLPPEALVEIDEGAIQLSPLIVGSVPVEALAQGDLRRAVVLAPPGTVERRFVLAQVLRVLEPGGRLVALAPKTRGGSRIASELEGFGCEVAGDSRRHFRIVETGRPDRPSGIGEAIAAGALRFDEALGLFTQGGVFSADREDPGSRLLLDRLPALSGRGADLGCGIGILGRKVLSSGAVTELAFVDLDRRAVDAARRNVEDRRAAFHWANLRQALPGLSGLDFVVTNPPFHDGGAEDRQLGQTFIRRAAEMLRKGAAAYVVANRHLPYEGVLNQVFRQVAVLAESGGYKIFEARK